MAAEAVHVVRAPGSVNLIGDHLDYNQGFVLSAAIGLDTWIAYRRRRDGLVQLVSRQSSASGSFWIGGLSPETRPSQRSWLDYAAGTAWSLREAALQVRGLDGVVDSTIPAWAEPSASAALELAAALALLGGGTVLAAPSLAALAQRAERDYVGLDGAIMSHLVSAGGRAGQAILLDCRSLDSRLVALPHGLTVVVCAVGLPPRDDAAILRARRAECGRAVLLLAERMPGLASLRDLDAAGLRRHRRLLSEALARRAEHVVSENARVLATAAALETGDLDALGRLYAESHQSARSHYEIGSPALDVMVAIARNVRGVVAARMAGAGMGGCTVNLVLDEAVPALAKAVESEFKPRTGLEARAFPVAIVDGAGLLASAR